MNLKDYPAISAVETYFRIGDATFDPNLVMGVYKPNPQTLQVFTNLTDKPFSVKCHEDMEEVSLQLAKAEEAKRIYNIRFYDSQRVDHEALEEDTEN